MFAVKILCTSGLHVLIVAVRPTGAVGALRARLDVPLRDAFVAVERLTVLTQERVLSVRRAVEVGPAIKVDVLVVSVLLGVARVRVEVGARVESLVDTRFAVEELSGLTTQRCFAAVVAVKVIATRRLQRSILVKPHLKVRALHRVRFVVALSRRRERADFFVDIERLTLAALVKLDRESERAFNEIAAAEARVDIEAVGFPLAELVEPRRLWTVVERVGHASLLLRMEHARRRASVSGGLPAEALDVGLAVFGVLVGVEAIEQVATVVFAASRPPHNGFRNVARDSLGVVAGVAVVQQPVSAVLVADEFAGGAAKEATTGLRRVRIKSVILSLTR